MADTISETPATLALAASNVANALGLSKDAVHVGLGTRDRGEGATTDDLGEHVLAVTITDPKVGANFGAMEKEVLEKLAKLGALKEVVQFESDAANVVHRRDDMEKFRIAGAAIPENFKEWIGFNPDNAERWGSIPKHALQDINRQDTVGIGFNIRIPEGDDAGKQGGAIKADLEARQGAILAVLQRRAEKYLTKGMNEADATAKKAQIAEQFKSITMEITFSEPHVGDDYTSPGQVTVMIQSKAQKESSVTFKDKVMSPEDKEALRNSNPLTASNSNKAASTEQYAITTADLGKALGRAVLFEGDNARTPTAIFPKIAGKEDMKTAITKQLVAFKAANAGMATQIDEFLNDEAFKGQDWNKPKRLQQPHKVVPRVAKDALDPTKANTMTVSFLLKADKAQGALDGLAKGGAGVAVSSPQATVLAQSGDMDMAAIADTLIKAGNSLGALKDKFKPAGGYAKTEDKRDGDAAGAVRG